MKIGQVVVCNEIKKNGVHPALTDDCFLYIKTDETKGVECNGEYYSAILANVTAINHIASDQFVFQRLQRTG